MFTEKDFTFKIYISDMHICKLFWLILPWYIFLILLLCFRIELDFICLLQFYYFFSLYSFFFPFVLFFFPAFYWTDWVIIFFLLYCFRRLYLLLFFFFNYITIFVTSTLFELKSNDISTLPWNLTPFPIFLLITTHPSNVSSNATSNAICLDSPD